MGDKILAIDPGITGACVVIDTRTKKVVDVYDFVQKEIKPSNGKGGKVFKEIDIAPTYHSLKDINLSVVVIERVASMNKMSMPSMFSFGDSFGCARALALLLSDNVVFVHPAKWKDYYGLKGGAKYKNLSRVFAEELSGDIDSFYMVKHHNRAEAYLLGRYWLDSGEAGWTYGK